MKTAYFDSSAIVKLGNAEAESLALIDYLCDEHLSVTTSVISDVEVRLTLARQRPRGADQDEHIRGFFVIDLNRDIRDRSVAIAGSLKALDAIHLATALEIDEDDLDFITYDARLADAARANGLRVVQPGR